MLDDQEELSGRDLDFAVAERVMGFSWRLFPNGRSLVPHETAPLAREDDPIHPNSGSQVPRYSELISDAMDVWERLRHSDRWCCLNIGSDYGYIWRLALTPAVESEDAEHKATVYIEGVDLPETICRAALEAIKSTVNEQETN